jgi:hypothetical protein
MATQRQSGDLPLSNLINGSRERPANTVGMPMTTPENVEVPSRYRAYSFEDDTMMKKDTCACRWRSEKYEDV